MGQVCLCAHANIKHTHTLTYSLSHTHTRVFHTHIHIHSHAFYTHFSENKDEIAWVNDLHKDCDGYADVYHQHDLFNSRTIMAHGIHLTDAEIELFRTRQVGCTVVYMCIYMCVHGCSIV